MKKLKNRFMPAAISAMLATTLAACGGGGGGASNTVTDANPVITSFPVQQALAYAFTHGLQATLTISGSTSNGPTTYPLTGSLTYALGIATNASFEGNAAMQSAESLNGYISANGSTQPLTINGQLFLNTQYAPLGESQSDSYCVATNTPAYPATAVAGQSGDIATMNCYADSSKRTLINVEKITYVTTAGSVANTLDFKMVTTEYGLSSTPQSTSSTTYTISTAGIPTLTRVQLSGTDNGISFSVDAK
jgi:hypothetical protein